MCVGGGGTVNSHMYGPGVCYDNLLGEVFTIVTVHKTDALCLHK